MKNAIFLLFLGSCLPAFAQRNSANLTASNGANVTVGDSAKLTAKFRFADGIYSTYADFSANKPNYAIKNLRGYLAINAKEYLAKSIIKPNDTLATNQIAATSVWGIVVDGLPYIRWQTDTAQQAAATTFLGLQLLGKICYFAYVKEENKTIKMPVYDPISGRKMYTGTIHNREKTSSRKILNFATGETADLNLPNLKKWVADDKKLLLTMADIAPNDVQQRLFKCLLIYNDRNSVFVRK